MNTVFSRFATWPIASPEADEISPMIIATLSRSIRRSALAEAVCGLTESSITSSILRPITPPLSLISSAASFTPMTAYSPSGPRKTLVDVIRDECGLTGTHIGCEHGICGACTVILDNEAVRSCLMFAVQAQGKRIRTVEGLADGDKLHPLQSAFIDHHALQCGFCTPGFLMLAVNALETNPHLTDEEIPDLLTSNLCRCTGYQNIVKAVRSTAAEMRRQAAR